MAAVTKTAWFQAPKSKDSLQPKGRGTNIARVPIPKSSLAVLQCFKSNCLDAVANRLQTAILF